jgi:polar amino acid transport system substrate-binding protein
VNRYQADENDEIKQMKKWCIGIFAWLILAGTIVTEAAEPCKLRVGWEPYAPYTFAGVDGVVTGADIDLIKAIGGEIGCTLEFAELPWARILREIENGTLDVSTSTSWTAERTRWALFSEPYRQTEMAIYVRRGETHRFVLQSLADVPSQSFRLGVIIDYYYGDELAELRKDAEYAQWLDGATDYQTNIRKLINGRLDGYLVEDVAVMAAELKRLGLTEQVERYPLRIAGEQLRFMFSRKTVPAEIVAKIDAGVAKMREDGRLDAILRNTLP